MVILHKSGPFLARKKGSSRPFRPVNWFIQLITDQQPNMMDELLFYLYLWFFLRPWAYLTHLMGVSTVLKFYSGSPSPSSLHLLIQFLCSLQYIFKVRQDFLGDLTTSGLVAALTCQLFIPRSLRWPSIISLYSILDVLCLQGGGRWWSCSCFAQWPAWL